MSQIASRLLHRLPKSLPNQSAVPNLRPRQGRWVDAVARHTGVLGSKRFAFLNQQLDLDLPTGWNDNRLPKLWLYNLHYFDDLGGDLPPVAAGPSLALAERWIAENPPTSGNGWEPYPLSLRIVNWLKFSLAHEGLTSTMRDSLAVQIRALEQRIEWQILGNHLFANGKALAFAGLRYEGPEADRWLRKGLRILDREMREQVLADGAHFERSPMYHAIILEDVLDLLNVGRAHPGLTGVRDLEWSALAARMLAWLSAMTHPDGEIAFFNDCALGIAPNLRQLSSYAGRLGLSPPNQTAEHLRDLSASGYARVDAEPFALIFDAAPIGPDYQPGHAHADTLSFELSIGAQRIFVNSGVSTYEANLIRAAERATSAHNTVEVDGENSSEVWSAFRVARRARIAERRVEKVDGFIVLEAAHDGYSRSGSSVRVSRRISVQPGQIILFDRLNGNWRAAITRLRIQPGLKAGLDTDGRGGWIAKDDKVLLAWTASAPGRLVPIHQAIAFNRREVTQEIQFEFVQNEITIRLRQPG